MRNNPLLYCAVLRLVATLTQSTPFVSNHYPCWRNDWLRKTFQPRCPWSERQTSLTRTHVLSVINLPWIVKRCRWRSLEHCCYIDYDCICMKCCRLWDIRALKCLYYQIKIPNGLGNYRGYIIVILLPDTLVLCLCLQNLVYNEHFHFWHH